MSYTVKYRLTFNNLFGDSCQLDLEERDAAAGVSDLTCTHSPIQITYDTASDFIFAPINGSRALLRLVERTNFQFRTMGRADARKHRTSLYITNEDSSEQVLWWRGFLQPQQGQGVYNQSPNTIEFVATDQLGYLKTLDWDREDVETELSMLGAILEKTGLDFNLYEAINVYEDTHDSTVADSPLDQTYINPKAFTGMKYYDALGALLFKYKAIIKQDRGNWVITRPEDSGAEYTRRYYTFSSGVFTYDSNETHDPIVNTTSAGATAQDDLVRISNLSPSYRVSAAWQKYKLTQKYGKIDNALDNGDFSEWSGPTLLEWNKYGVFDYYQEIEGVRMNCIDRTDERITQRIYCKHDRASVSVNWEVYVLSNDHINATVRIRRQIVGQPTPLYWDFDNNAWTYTGTPYFNYDYDNSGGGAAIVESGSFNCTLWHSFNFGNTEYIEIELAPPRRIGGSSTDSYLRWKEAKIQFTGGGQWGSDTIPFDEENEHEVEINPNNTTDGGALEMLLSDVLQSETIWGTPQNYLQFVYKGGLWLDVYQLTPTESWTDSSGTGSLVELMQNGLSWHYSSPTDILQVSIFSKLIYSTSVIQEVVSGTNRLHMIKKATWDVKYCKWTIEGYEIGTGAGLALLAEDETEILAEDGTTIRTEGLW